jgi:hypothetical protein
MQKFFIENVIVARRKRETFSNPHIGLVKGVKEVIVAPFDLFDSFDFYDFYDPIDQNLTFSNPHM